MMNSSWSHRLSLLGMMIVGMFLGLWLEGSQLDALRASHTLPRQEWADENRPYDDESRASTSSSESSLSSEDEHIDPQVESLVSSLLLGVVDKEEQDDDDDDVGVDVDNEPQDTKDETASDTHKDQENNPQAMYNRLAKYGEINNDPRCHWEDGSSSSSEEDPNNKPHDRLVGEDDVYNLGGICCYSYPIRFPPAQGYLNEIDFFELRTEQDMQETREQCFVDCVDMLQKHNMIELIQNHQLLLDASIMGLPRVVERLLQLGLDPLFTPKSDPNMHQHAKTNSIQRAIQGGHADVVLLLSGGNNDLSIDEHQRTIKDYVRMKGSPIRPYFAKTILGIHVDVDGPSEQPAALRRRRTLKSSEYLETIGDSGWSSHTVYEYDDTKCDLEIVSGNISKEFFFHHFYIPGRPFVLRQASPIDEVQNFHKPRVMQTKTFEPTQKFKVGPTAYPASTGQEQCPATQSLLELEAGLRCSTFPEKPMVSGWHPQAAHLQDMFPQYEGDILHPNGGFRSIQDWFGSTKDVRGKENELGWQVFFGGDGSGATYHWHAAAFNILYVGIKEWRIAPPIYRGRTGMDAIHAAQALDEHYTLQCVQQPGDQIFLPNFWGHLTLNHGFTIGAAAILNVNYQAGIKRKYKRKQPRDKKIIHGAQSKMSWAATSHVRPNTLPHTSSSLAPSFLFLHINKTGGTSLIHMFRERCRAEYIHDRWGDEGRRHRSFHATAHAYIERYGRDVYNTAYTFAIVRHPLARQVSNFFFLVDRCLQGKGPGGICDTRHIPISVDGVVISEASDEQKIRAFDTWLEQMYHEFPPDSRDHYQFGSHGHGNEEYETFNATQTSWLVDPDGHMAVNRVYKLEDLSQDMSELAGAIPCLERGPIEMTNENPSPKYPHYTLFAENETTKRIIQQVYAVDFENFGYEWS